MLARDLIQVAVEATAAIVAYTATAWRVSDWQLLQYNASYVELHCSELVTGHEVKLHVSVCSTVLKL